MNNSLKTFFLLYLLFKSPLNLNLYELYSSLGYSHIFLHCSSQLGSLILHLKHILTPAYLRHSMPTISNIHLRYVR